MMRCDLSIVFISKTVKHIERPIAGEAVSCLLCSMKNFDLPCEKYPYLSNAWLMICFEVKSKR